MEKFILVFRGSEVYEQEQPPEALQSLTIKMMDWVVSLNNNGRHVSSEHWQRTGRQISGKDRQVAESPYKLNKDIIGGSTTVLAADLDEAIEIAKACPILESNASIEVRPVQTIS